VGISNAESLRRVLSDEFGTLLDKCQGHNHLLFLLNLHGWAGLGGYLQFRPSTVLFVESALCDFRRADGSVSIPAHAGIAMLQLLYEDKSTLFQLQNVCNQVIIGRNCAPIPLESRKHAFGWDKPGPVRWSTSRLWQQLSADLRSTDCRNAADVIDSKIITDIGFMRNAIAHGTFQFPVASNDGHWHFRQLRSDGNRHDWECRTYTSAEFSEACLCLLAWHRGWILALREAVAPYQDKSIEFSARNPANPGEWLECGLRDGAIRIVQGDVPFWA